MIISDGAISALEQGKPVWEFRIAVKRETVGGVDFMFFGFDDPDAWATLIKTANPDMRQNMLTAMERYIEMSGK